MIFFVLFIFVCIFICNSNVFAISYNVGDKVKFENEEYYVLYDAGNYLSLLKDKNLYSYDINNIDAINDIIEKAKDNMIRTDFGENNNYDNSNIKKVLDTWITKFNIDDLVKDKYGYYTRILYFSEILNFGTEYRIEGTENRLFMNEDTPFFINSKSGYLIANDTNDDQQKVYSCAYESYSELSSDTKIGVRPVLNVKKEKVKLIFSRNLENEESVINKLEYSVGEVVNYNGIKFYVLRDSKKNDNTVTLIKATPLSISDVNYYGKGHGNMFIPEQNSQKRGEAKSIGKYGGIAYYTSETCKKINGISNISSGCTNDYNKSEIKYVVDAWVNDKLNKDDLGIDDNGYSSRLLNDIDLIDYLHYENSNKDITEGGEYLKYTEYTPKFNLDYCWSMTTVHDYSNYILIRGANGYFYSTSVYNPDGTVCPVIILKKKFSESVNVPNTKSDRNLLIIIFSLIVVLLVSVIVFLKNFNGKKNNEK